MLCAGPTYSPTILYARQRVRGAEVEQHDPSYGRSGMFLPGIYRLLLVEEGSARIDMAGGEAVLRAGHIGLITPGQCRAIDMAQDSRGVMIGFLAVAGAEVKRPDQERRLQLTDHDHTEPDPVAVWGYPLPFLIPESVIEQIAHAMRQIAAIWWQDDWNHFRANHILSQALFYLVGSQRHELDAVGDSTDTWVKNVQQLIDQRLHLLHSTADLAAAFNRNPKALARTFAAHIGVTPAVYLRRRRLERAIELILTTHLPIRVVADQVGYRSASALNHAWKERFSLSPMAWRRQRQA